MRILLAEDEEVAAAVVGGTLTSMGHQVTVATDGLDAWRVFQLVCRPMTFLFAPDCRDEVSI